MPLVTRFPRTMIHLSGKASLIPRHQCYRARLGQCLDRTGEVGRSYRAHLISLFLYSLDPAPNNDESSRKSSEAHACSHRTLGLATIIGDLAHSVPTPGSSSFRLACWIFSGDAPCTPTWYIVSCPSITNASSIILYMDIPASTNVFLATPPLACYNTEICMFRDQSLASCPHVLNEVSTASPSDSIRPSSEHIMVPGGFTCAISLQRAW